MTETIWIVGGSGDIGRAIGREFGGRGWRVWLSARTPARLRDAADELRADGIETETVRLDAAAPSEVQRGVSRLAESVEHLDVLVYNVSPQTGRGDGRLESYLRHTAIGAATALESLREVELLPRRVIVPTSSKARTPAAVSPDYHAAKQALFAFVESFAETHELAHTVLLLGRRGTERDWRWLHPEEMAAKAWEAFETGEAELLVGDLY